MTPQRGRAPKTGGTPPGPAAWLIDDSRHQPLTARLLSDAGLAWEPLAGVLDGSGYAARARSPWHFLARKVPT